MESGQLRKLNLCYAGIQSLYWAGFAAIWLFVGAASIPWLQQQPDRYGVCAGAADALGGAAGAGVAGGPGPTLHQPPSGHGPDRTSAAVRRGAVVIRREHGGDGGLYVAGGHLL